MVKHRAARAPAGKGPEGRFRSPGHGKGRPNAATGRAADAKLESLDKLMKSVYQTVHDVTRDKLDRRAIHKQNSDKLERLGVPKLKKATSFKQHRQLAQERATRLVQERETGVLARDKRSAEAELRAKKAAKKAEEERQRQNQKRNVGDVSNLIQFGRYKADSATVKVSESDYRAMFGITHERPAAETEPAKKKRFWRNKGEAKRRQKRKARHFKR